MAQKILVTGGTGYIGSHTVVELLDRGYEILIVDNLSNSTANVVTAIEKACGKKPMFVKCDLLNKTKLMKIFDAFKPNAVMHFAGLKAVGESVNQPLRYYDNNVTGTINLLECMQEHGVKKIVFSSSACVYGAPESVPVKETANLRVTNPYGATKLYIEGIIRDVQIADPTFTAIILRYFNPIGAHASGFIGENPRDIPNNLAPFIAQVALDIRPYLNVYGKDYKTRDGTGIRDYIHVVDLAQGHVSALEKITTAGEYTYNLGTGKGTSVLELLASFEKACGKKIEYKIAKRRAGDVAESYADVSKAKKELGWTAKLSIDDACKSMWNFYKTNHKTPKKC